MQTPYLHLTQPDYNQANWYAAMNSNLQTIDQHIQIIEQQLNSSFSNNSSGAADVQGAMLFGAADVENFACKCEWPTTYTTIATASQCICQVIFNQISASNDGILTGTPLEIDYTYTVEYKTDKIVVTVTIDNDVVVPTNTRALIILTAVT